MRHTESHLGRELILYRDCLTCYEALTRAWVKIAPELKDLEPGEVIEGLQRILKETA